MGALNNSLSNAFNSLVGNIAGVANGRNPLTQPQVADLFGFNIQGTPLVSTRDYFLLQLESWLTSIPLQTQWIILIQPFPQCINTEILQGLEVTGGDYKNFNVSQAKNILTSFPFQKVNGCIFAQKVTIPGETMNVSPASVENNRGFLPGITSGGRGSSYTPNSISIDFLETNTSFSDFVLRPWIIASEHFGFVARERDSDRSRDVRNVKSTVYVMEYGKTYQHVSMIPKKVWTFFNCVPTSVEQYTLDYVEPNTPPIMKSTWTYTNYAVANSLYLPLPNIINTISGMFKGKFPQVSPFQGGIGGGSAPKNLIPYL